MKIIKINKKIIVQLDNGVVFENDDCSNEMFDDIISNSDNEDYLTELFAPGRKEIAKRIEEGLRFIDNINRSEILSINGDCIYIKSISDLSVPKLLVEKIIEAELNENNELIQSYLNFWNLCSLNPDSRARINLFWFLNKYGMKITKNGLFVAYRNVVSKCNPEYADFISNAYLRIKKNKKSPQNYIAFYADNNTLNYSSNKDIIPENNLGNIKDLYNTLSQNVENNKFTDNYTKTFDIRIGNIVSIPRHQCDNNQENTCSYGLHVASAEWLKNNTNFGNTSIMCLINPAMVVGVPPQDNYGKMRVCEYYPVKIVNIENGIVDDEIEDGFEDDFLDITIHNLEINNKEETQYNMNIQYNIETDNNIILENLKKIQKNKVIN